MYRRGKKCGIAAICAGLVIILALIMPAAFWIVLLGVTLIVCGLIMCRR